VFRSRMVIQDRTFSGAVLWGPELAGSGLRFARVVQVPVDRCRLNPSARERGGADNLGFWISENMGWKGFSGGFWAGDGHFPGSYRLAIEAQAVQRPNTHGISRASNLRVCASELAGYW
jgi:hypothetical protein